MGLACSHEITAPRKQENLCCVYLHLRKYHCHILPSCIPSHLFITQIILSFIQQKLLSIYYVPETVPSLWYYSNN